MKRPLLSVTRAPGAAGFWSEADHGGCCPSRCAWLTEGPAPACCLAGVDSSETLPAEPDFPSSSSTGAWRERSGCIRISIAQIVHSRPVRRSNRIRSRIFALSDAPVSPCNFSLQQQARVCARHRNVAKVRNVRGARSKVYESSTDGKSGTAGRKSSSLLLSSSVVASSPYFLHRPIVVR